MDTPYLYYKNPNADKLETGKLTKFHDAKVQSPDEEFYYPDGADLRVMIWANSFARNLVEFLPYSFKHTLRLYDNYRRFDIREYEPFIKEWKPDIIVLNFQTSYINNLLNLFEKNVSGTDE